MTPHTLPTMRACAISAEGLLSDLVSGFALFSLGGTSAPVTIQRFLSLCMYPPLPTPVYVLYVLNSAIRSVFPKCTTFSWLWYPWISSAPRTLGTYDAHSSHVSFPPRRRSERMGPHLYSIREKVDSHHEGALFLPRARYTHR